MLVRIAPGVDLRSLLQSGFSSEPLWLNVVFPYDGVAGDVVNVDKAGLVIRGTHLGNDVFGAPGNFGLDGPLVFADESGTVMPGLVSDPPPWLPRALVALPDKLIIAQGQIEQITEPSTYLEVRSDRGTARTPWPVGWAANPRAFTVRATSVDPATCSGVCPESVPYGEVIEVTGAWFDRVTSLTFRGASASGDGTVVDEPLAKNNSPSATPGLGEYVVVDRNHLRLKISGSGGTVSRGLAPVWSNGLYLGGETYPGTRWVTFGAPDGEADGWYWASVGRSTPALVSVSSIGFNGIVDGSAGNQDSPVYEQLNQHALLRTQGFDARTEISSVTLYPYMGSESIQLEPGEAGYVAANASSLVITNVALSRALLRHPLVASDSSCHAFGVRVTLSGGVEAMSGLWINYCVPPPAPPPPPPPIVPPTQNPIPIPIPLPSGGGTNSITP
jgi:hypothetical protein